MPIWEDGGGSISRTKRISIFESGCCEERLPMTIYVDDYRVRRSVPYKGEMLDRRWSHMMSDISVDELVQFASRLGMSRSWLQYKPSGVHFDVTDQVRARALRNGAVELPCRSDEWLRVHRASIAQYNAHRASAL